MAWRDFHDITVCTAVFEAKPQLGSANLICICLCDTVSALITAAACEMCRHFAGFQVLHLADP